MVIVVVILIVLVKRDDRLFLEALIARVGVDKVLSVSGEGDYILCAVYEYGIVL